MQEAQNGKFTFEVDGEATKPAIKKAVKDAFKVDAVSVATIIAKGKRARFGKRRVEKEFIMKKAIVTLKKGQTIALFDIQKEEKEK